MKYLTVYFLRKLIPGSCLGLSIPVWDTESMYVIRTDSVKLCSICKHNLCCTSCHLEIYWITEEIVCFGGLHFFWPTKMVILHKSPKCAFFSGHLCLHPRLAGDQVVFLCHVFSLHLQELCLRYLPPATTNRCLPHFFRQDVVSNVFTPLPHALCMCCMSCLTHA